MQSLDPGFKLETGEKPGKALKRLNVSKTIAAKQFADLISAGSLKPNGTTVSSITHYLKQLATALKS